MIRKAGPAGLPEEEIDVEDPLVALAQRPEYCALDSDRLFAIAVVPPIRGNRDMIVLDAEAMARAESDYRPRVRTYQIETVDADGAGVSLEVELHHHGDEVEHVRVHHEDSEETHIADRWGFDDETLA